MASFSTEIKINAPVEDVWEVLADFGAIHRWNPGVVASHVTTDEETGLGACRHCDLGGRNYLHEEVVEWQPAKRLSVRIIGTNLPYKTADIPFTLRPQDGGTLVTLSPDYELKFGVLGKLFDRLYVRRAYLEGMKGLLAGLKRYVETGEQC